MNLCSDFNSSNFKVKSRHLSGKAAWDIPDLRRLVKFRRGYTTS